MNSWNVSKVPIFAVKYKYPVYIELAYNESPLIARHIVFTHRIDFFIK